MKKIIESLIESQRTVFSVGMLGYFWGEEDDVALRKKISYHAKVGFLEKITRGIYTVKGMSVNGMELANMMYSPSYVSFETALYYHGVIFQVNPKQIDVAYKKSDTRIIESVDLIIHLRALKQSVLMNPTGVMYIKNVSLASAERAFLDMIYLNKDYYFDNLEILDQTKIQDLLGIYGREKMMKKRLKQYFPNIKVGQQ